MFRKVIIIGAGLAGASLARILAEKKWVVDIYEQKNHVGGNCYDEYDSYGVLYHRYGPHIFHTDKPDVINFVTRFAKFNNYINKVVADVDSRLINLPVNFHTIRMLYPQQSQSIIEELKRIFPKQKSVSIMDILALNNFLLQVPFQNILATIYQPYTEKMWGVKFNEIDPSVIARVGITLSFDQNYFPSATFQGLPTLGYTQMIQKMLDHVNIKVHLQVNGCDILKFVNDQVHCFSKLITHPIVYCGSIDELFQFRFGHLKYRSLEFEFMHYDLDKFQSYPIINYPKHPQLTRSVEYKQLTQQMIANVTVVSREFPNEFNSAASRWNQRYYPYPNASSRQVYQQYLTLAKKYPNLYFLGRLAQYRYYNMDDVISEAFLLANKLGTYWFKC